MPQKYASVVLEDNKLGLYDDNDCITESFENVCVSNGIKTSYKCESFASIVEPNRQTALDDALSNIGGICAVFQFDTFANGQLKSYLILCSHSLILYYYELNIETPSLVCFDTISLSDIPHFETFCLDNKNVLIISSRENAMWVWDGSTSPVEVLDSPKIYSATVGLGKLFVAAIDKPYSICFSEDLDPSSWSMSSGDIMELHFADNLGKVLKLVSLDNYVFAFRERGIVKVYTKSNGELISSKVISFSGNIYEKTICVCEDAVVFATSCGIYKFDGLNIKKIYKNFFVRTNQFDTFEAVCKDTDYYLFASAQSSQTAKVFVVDYRENIIDGIVDIDNFVNVFVTNINNDLFVGYIGAAFLQKNAKTPIFITKNSENLANNVKFCYQTKKIYIKQKQKNSALLYVDVLSKTNIDMLVSGTYEDKTISIFGSNYPQRIMLNMRTQFFKIVFSGQAGADIDSCVVCYSYVER